MSRIKRKEMINKDRTDLSLARQCKLLKVSRSSLYYVPVSLFWPARCRAAPVSPWGGRFSAGSRGHSWSCASNTVVVGWWGIFPQAPPRSPWRRLRWPVSAHSCRGPGASAGPRVPLTGRALKMPERGLWVLSRTPSSIARQCLSPRVFTPITTSAQSLSLSPLRPL